MAVEAVTGATPAWFVEYDKAPSKILAHHWPGVPNYGDVTAVDWSAMPPVDILTGGYPCQPFSHAGRRKGETDDRHLWPYVREAIRVLRPRITILENVAGHRSLGFDRVLGDMAEDGLHVRWTSLRASDIGAPHHRERLFIVASFPDPEGSRRDHGPTSHVGEAHRKVDTPGDDSHAAADAFDGEQDEPKSADRKGYQRSASGRPVVRPGGCGDIIPADPEGERLSGQNQPRRCAEEVTSADSRFGSFSDPDRQRRDGRGATPEQEGRTHAPTDRHRSGVDFGPYTEAVQRWEHLTRPAPAPTEPNTKGNPRLNAGFAEWMMGLPEGHVTQVPGISRANQLKAIGNGVCVPQAVAALTTLLEMEGI